LSLALQLVVYVDVDGEYLRDGSLMCPEMVACVGVCRALYSLAPADLRVAEEVSAGYADADRFFVLCFACVHMMSPMARGRLQLVNDELAALGERMKVRMLKWLSACKMLSELAF
jgi:hypothetical protein